MSRKTGRGYKILLMRHSEPRWDQVASLGLKGWGVNLIPLTERGVADAKRTIPLLKERGIKLILSSPMTRCLQTASILSFGLGVEGRVAFSPHEWIPDLTFSWDSYEQVRESEASMVAMGGEWPAGSGAKWEPISRVRARALPEIEPLKGHNSSLCDPRHGD